MRFVELTNVALVAFAPSQTTPGHGNIMVATPGLIAQLDADDDGGS